MERVRFAPSPTGPLHIGGLRTALFNYLYARRNGGTFILRVEDTDQNRKVDGSEEYIHETLEWCGMIPDEGPEYGGEYGPYRQSERRNIYKEKIKELIDKGKAYYAFDTSEALEKARKESEKITGGFKYNAYNRMDFSNSLTMNDKLCKEAIAKNNFVVRLKVDPEKQVVVDDLVRGRIQVNAKELEDKILMKGDGMPTYHFANIVDDHLMKITTVIRGEEWLPSLPIHKLLYDAFGWSPPKFMHLPLILNPSGKGKLSKRDGDKNGYPVFPLAWKDTEGYRDKGFLPVAVLNYIAQLGWSLNDEEIRDLNRMEKSFEVKEVQKGGARFDYVKAVWVNQQHIGKMSTRELMEAYPERFRNIDVFEDKKTSIVELIKSRLMLLDDISSEVKPFLNDPAAYDEKALKRIQKFDIQKITEILVEILESEDVTQLKNAIVVRSEKEGIGMGAFMQIMRVAVVGALSGPDIITMVEILGKNVTLKRIKRLINIT